jgi:hypothetical protein
VLRVFCCCFRKAIDKIRALLCSLKKLLKFLLGIRCIPRYVYGLFCESIGSC